MPRQKADPWTGPNGEMLFGPDRLPYAQALAREHAKQPPLPGASDNGSVKKPTRVVAAATVGYASSERKTSVNTTTTRRVSKMAPRTSKAPAAPAAENKFADYDYEAWTSKFDEDGPTATIEALAEFLEEVTGRPIDVFSVAASGTHRFAFQANQKYKARVEEIRAERAAEKKASSKSAAKDEGEGDEGEETPAPKATRGRTPAAAKTTSTSSTSKPTTRARGAAAGKPAGRTSDRPARGKATAGKAAPF